MDAEGVAAFEFLRHFVRTLLAVFTESGQPMGMVLFGDSKHAEHLYSRHIRPRFDACVHATEVAITRWPHRDYDIRAAMSAAFGMSFWHALARRLEGHEEDLDEAAERLADVIFNGIRAR